MLLSCEDKSIIKKSLIFFGVTFGTAIVLSAIFFPLLDEKILSPVEGFQMGLYISLSVGFLPLSFTDTNSEGLAILVKILGTLGYGVIGYIFMVLIKGLKSVEKGSIP